jgi:hypothetical protein
MFRRVMYSQVGVEWRHAACTKACTSLEIVVSRRMRGAAHGKAEGKNRVEDLNVDGS